MQDVREIIREKGRWEGERIGLRKGQQQEGRHFFYFGGNRIF